MATNFFFKAPNFPDIKKIKNTEGSYVSFYNHRGKFLDLTSGRSTLMCLGYSNKMIINEMIEQLKKFPHVDCNVYENTLAEKVAKKLISFNPKGLDKVYFSGSSGSDAIEAAMKLSYQIHLSKGYKNKNMYVSREYSYHGATLGAMSVSNFYKHKSYKKILPKNNIIIPEHNFFEKCNKSIKRCNCAKLHKDENLDLYTNRSVNFLEKVLKKNINRISAFIGSTQLSVGQGHSQPTKKYWSRISDLCKKYDVHLILDEIYSGCGRSGEYFNFNNYNVSPDFVCIGKNFTAGYAPLSAVITKNIYQKIIKENIGEFYHAHTFQGYAVGLAAAYGSMKYINKFNILGKIKKDSDFIIKKLKQNLNKNKNFVTIRGIGLHLSIEYNFQDNNKFANYFRNEMFKKKIIINSMPRFINLSPTYILSKKEIVYAIDSITNCFLKYKN